jgi:hypothetical protein
VCCCVLLCLQTSLVFPLREHCSKMCSNTKLSSTKPAIFFTNAFSENVFCRIPSVETCHRFACCEEHPVLYAFTNLTREPPAPHWFCSRTQALSTARLLFSWRVTFM